MALLCDRLPEEDIAEWEQVLARASGPQDPLLSRFAGTQTASGLPDRLREIIQLWRTECPDLPGRGLALAFAAVRALPRPARALPVVSGPLGPLAPARLTAGVVLEVIRSAASSLLISSFAAHGAADIVGEIREAVIRGVRVDLLLEETTHAAAAFAALPTDVHVWHRATAGGVLHAKLVAADRHTAFVGSANLTDRALTDNIELGLVIRDPAVTGPLVDHFRWLIAPGTGLMRQA
ncbi:DISARM system phospholipase D-like protein DrmC [Streptomyces sp. NPDC056160]|uniref:DISARM system phospholipase D-like protein DrmC n=1 Tax=Streptomyces sp. NPDC056160 TaxID=3345731 RepID=UPI0035DB6576